MTRIEYWLRAQTQYSVHSPFVYDMYREVLFARVAHGVVHGEEDYGRRFEEVRYKLMDRYGLKETWRERGLCRLEGAGDVRRVVIVDRPHGSREAEQRWAELRADDGYRVSIDMYDVGLLIDNKHLHRQHFMLK